MSYFEKTRPITGYSLIGNFKKNALHVPVKGGVRFNLYTYQYYVLLRSY